MTTHHLIRFIKTLQQRVRDPVAPNPHRYPTDLDRHRIRMKLLSLHTMITLAVVAGTYALNVQALWCYSERYVQALKFIKEFYTDDLHMLDNIIAHS